MNNYVGYILPADLVEELKEYLLDHEDDIAHGINDSTALDAYFQSL